MQYVRPARKIAYLNLQHGTEITIFFFTADYILVTQLCSDRIFASARGVTKWNIKVGVGGGSIVYTSGLLTERGCQEKATSLIISVHLIKRIRKESAGRKISVVFIIRT